ncbi:hypothetical protein BH11PLA2_BH11PLA2_17260 [soil metagenome]
MPTNTLPHDPLDLLAGRVGRTPRGQELLAIQREAAQQTPLSLEAILRLLPDSERYPGTILELILAEIATRRHEGEHVAATDYTHRFPVLAETLEMLFDPEFESIGISGLIDVGHALDSAALQATEAPQETPPLLSRRKDPLPAIAGYAILAVLGRGGMGIVYKGLHLRLDRIVALKMMAGVSVSPARRLRFLAEAEMVASMQHPNIVQLYEVGEHEGESFFTLEYCPGGNLITKYGTASLLPHTAARIVADLAKAIAYAHHSNILHRDLKPENVLLAADGTPKLTDFGLARRLDDDAGLTATGDLLGTPAYMAPEQASPNGSTTGPAADIYGLGAILYCLLTGRPPFAAITPLATLQKVLHTEPEPPRMLNPTMPRDLESICLLALAKEPRHRYATAEMLAEDLERFLAGQAVLARPVPRAVQAWRWARRNRGLSLALTSSAAGLMGVTALSIVTAFTARRNAQLQNQLVIAERSRLLNLSQVEQILHSRVERAYADVLQSRFDEAERNLAVAEHALSTVDSPPEWSARLKACRDDVHLASRLEDANLLGAEFSLGPVRQDGFDSGTLSDRTYEQHFRNAGFPLLNLTPDAAASALQKSPLRELLATTLLRWGFQTQDRDRKIHLYGIAAELHDEPLQKRFLIAVRDRTPQVIHALTEAELFSLPSEFIRLGALMQSPKSDLLLKRALIARPDDFWLYVHLGKVLRLKGDPVSLSEAAGYLRTALALRPRSAGPYALLGTVLYESGQPREAIELCRSWLQPGRDNPAIHFVMARSWDRLGDAKAAEAEYRAAISADVSYSIAYFNLAYLVNTQGRADEAAALYDHCLQLSPTDAQAIVNRGLIDLERDQACQAEQYFRKAIQLAPKLMYAHNALGRALQKQGKLAEAAAAYREALKITPEHPTVLKNLEAVEQLIRQSESKP